MIPTPSPLPDALHQLQKAGADGNRLVVSRGSAWFVIHGARGETQLRCEAAASYYLPREARLSAARVAVLRQAGFGQAAGQRTLQRHWSPGSATEREALAVELDRLFVEVYDRPAGEPVELRLDLGATELVENPRLAAAIRALANARSQRMRNRMYSELLSAQLLVPMDAAGEMLTFGELEGWPVYGCFTDSAELRGWDPRGVPTRVVPGVALFPALMQTRVGSLLVNPQGRLGGELYRNEIEALASAARARR